MTVSGIRDFLRIYLVIFTHHFSIPVVLISLHLYIDNFVGSKTNIVMKTFNVTIAAFLISILSGIVCKAQEKTLLYEISGNGLENPSYLFGTIHIMCEGELTFSNELRNALRSTSQVAFELDMDSPDLMTELQAGFMMDSGTSLKSFYSAKEYKVINNYLTESFGQNADAFGMMKPFFINSLLYPQFMGCQTVSMEMELMNSRPSGNEVVGLETVQDQLNAINMISLDQQADLLLEAIENVDAQKKDFEQMLALYRSRDVEEIYQISQREFNETEGFSEVILDKRNINWIPVMSRMMAEKPTFFAVGVAHLGGKNGVIKLLEAEGYTVKPVVEQALEKGDNVELGKLGKSIIGRWKIDNSHVDEITDQAIDRVLESNPGMEDQILAQRSLIEEMVKNTIKEYKSDGTYVLVIPNGGGNRTGTWTIDESESTLVELDDEGEEMKREIIELSGEKLRTLKEGEKERIFNRVK